jgi:hypothetical protein
MTAATTRTCRVVIVLGWCLALFSGCGTPTGTVAGKVMWKGKAVTSGQVAFIPADGVPINAAIQPDGAYEVKNVPAGEAIVLVSQPNPDALEWERQGHKAREQYLLDLKTNPELPLPEALEFQGPASLLPLKYADPGTSDLRCKVNAGVNNHDIDLK